MGNSSSSWTHPLNPSPRLLSLTFQWTNSSLSLAHFFSTVFLESQSRAPPRLSLPASSTLSPSFVSLFPALINILSKSPGLVLWVFPAQSQEFRHSTGQVVQRIGMLSCALKRCRFDSWSGNIPRLWILSLVGEHTGGNRLMFLSHFRVSPSHRPSLTNISSNDD